MANAKPVGRHEDYDPNSKHGKVIRVERCPDCEAKEGVCKCQDKHPKSKGKASKKG